ncbi:MAG: NADH-quinone oxidoreductase subunit NuoG, partial [Desulfosarcina sp.]
MPKLTIDNLEIEVPDGTKVIDAASRLGIEIPRFCYHPALGSVGACRVCAVAFEDGPVKGIQMSCMIDAQDGMVVSTTDPEAVDFRRHVLEFLMLNHPHDCPVCDEGGHCLLQDLTVAGNHGMRRYQGLKRTHHNQDLGPLVQHEMNRCIQCYRCSRYYQEYTGYKDLGVMGIGSRVYFGRDRSGVLESPFTGNLSDICPTGVYTDKPSRYFGRRWDYERQPSVCIHCSLGCSLTASARYRRVARHEARPNAEVNGYFICDRGRYAYAYASADSRPRQALVHGEPAAMPATLSAAHETIQGIADQHGPDSVAVVVSPRCSLEALAVALRACKRNAWTGPAAASTTRQAVNLKTAVNGLQPQLAVSMTDLATAHDVLVVGADPLNEAPMLALALRQVHRHGGRVTVIDPRGVSLPFKFDHWAVQPSRMTAVLEALIQHIDTSRVSSAAASRQSAEVDAFPAAALAKRLNSSPRPVVVCGTDIVTPADIKMAADLAGALCRTHILAGLFYTLSGGNAFSTGLIHDAPLSIEQIIAGIEAGRIRGLVAVEADLWRDFPNRNRLQAALKQLDHLIVLDYVDTPLIKAAGSFIPTQTIYECGGSWINNEGRLQAADALIAGGEPIEITSAGDHPPRIFEKRIPGSGPLPAWQAMLALAGDEDESAAKALDAAIGDLQPSVRLPLRDGVGQRIRLEISSARETAGSGTEDHGFTANPDDGITLL